MTFKFLHKIKRILLTLLVLCPLFTAAQNTCKVTASNLNIRKVSSSDGAVIGAVSKGDIVNVREMKTYWAEIDYKNSVGYVSKEYIQPVVEEQSQEPEIIVEEKEQVKVTENQNVENESNKKDSSKKPKKIHFRFTSTLSFGLSNFYSPDAYSHPRFGFGVDVGCQFTADFLPKWMFVEVDIGFMELGNSNYTFPSFIINVLPISYRSDLVGKHKNLQLYVAGGLTFQFSGRNNIRFYREEEHYKLYVYYFKPTINFYIKGGVEINDQIAVGVFYMHGLSDVCRDLPIRISNSVFQIYCSFVIKKMKKK